MEVDLMLNDGSKQINVTGWKKNASFAQRVDTSRRRSRRCLLMTLALANTVIQQSNQGPTNKLGACEKCHGDFHTCPGHFGYLPIYNIGYISHILDILKCICKFCSRILLEEEKRVSFLKKMRNPNFDHLKKLGISNRNSL